MKAAYFDIFSGISGNMVLGALLDAGLKLDILKKELSKLNISDYELQTEKVVKNGISGTYLKVKLSDDDHCHEDHEHQHGRHLSEIEDLIAESDLEESVKDLSTRIFRRLAESEARIHNTDPDQVHFHEVGAVDAIVDIVGTAIGIHKLGIKKVFASRIHIGTGFGNCAHGKIPIPAPATLDLLQDTPVYSTGIESELVTPTGAAIITTLAEEFGSLPLMQIRKIGYGAGSRNLEIPNLLRISTGKLV
ncbi:nickel pincer cofactor biosynthesis protein LarC [Sporohalobacter salinus]|uniref:nickel pincer cofactor biosynthesis protein LarC n=1 Tax=Sporohalobacter salinus TaxID=1494606 RepID=UPI001960FEF6|nr:nickel pincer cofactor biosynthesis protein LarC [Sporohalobacter salinus]MBM7623050.1 uncharacterized protein (TIGR00299 family) protein [Sporohalobacter salinus]